MCLTHTIKNFQILLNIPFLDSCFCGPTFAKPINNIGR